MLGSLAYPRREESEWHSTRHYSSVSETPGVPGREDRQREIAREELEDLTDEVHTDALGSVIGTKRGRDDVRVMVAAHMDEIGFFVRHIDDNGFIRLQPLGGRSGEHGLAACHRHDGERRLARRAAATRKPPHLQQEGDRKVPKVEEFFVDLGMPADEVKEAVRVGDYATMDRTLEKVEGNYLGKAMDDRVGVFVMLEALRALGDHEATIHAVATSQEEVGLRGAEASGWALAPTVVIALDITLADVPGTEEEGRITELARVSRSR